MQNEIASWVKKPIKIHKILSPKQADAKMESTKKTQKRQLGELQGHVVYDDEQISVKKRKSENQNTLKSEERAHHAFTRFLTQCNVDSEDYWCFTEPELEKYLAKFYLGA